jgi:hypothetical protein
MPELTPPPASCRGEIPPSPGVHRDFTDRILSHSTRQRIFGIVTSSLLRLLAIVATVACVALVGTIEGLNVQANDAIGRKQRQEPHSKWRLWHPEMERRETDRRFRLEQNIPPDQALAPSQSAEVERLARERCTRGLPGERLARVMRNYSAWGFPVGLLALVLGVVAWPGQKTALRIACCSVGALTAILAAVRYIPSLGW